MKLYRLYDIEWDTDVVEGAAACNVTPSTTNYMVSDRSIDDLRGGDAADWLSDHFGFLVKSLKVEEVAPERGRMFTVYVERTERYSLPVNVVALSGEEAEEKVRKMDGQDKFASEWNELQPEVETVYEAAEADEPDQGEGSLT